MAITVGSAPIPAPKKVVVKREPSDLVKDLTKALADLPADNLTFIEVEGKSAKGVALVAGKVATTLGFAIRTAPQTATVVRVWKIALTDEQLAARAVRKLKAKENKAKKEAANLADLKAE